MYFRRLEENSWSMSQRPVQWEYHGPGVLARGEAACRYIEKHAQSRAQIIKSDPSILKNK